MSRRDAAGCALSRSQGVSVVPMIQCRPHGMTNSTDSRRTHDQTGLGADPVTRHDQVDSLAGLDVERTASAHHLLDLVGPHPGCVDHHASADLDLAAGLEVDGADPDDPLALSQEADDLGAVRAQRAVRRGGAGDRHDQPRVIDLGVEVLDRSREGLGAEVGGDPCAPAGAAGAGAAAGPCRTCPPSPWPS